MREPHERTNTHQTSRPRCRPGRDRRSLWPHPMDHQAMDRTRRLPGQPATGRHLDNQPKPYRPVAHGPDGKALSPPGAQPKALTLAPGRRRVIAGGRVRVTEALGLASHMRYGIRIPRSGLKERQRHLPHNLLCAIGNVQYQPLTGAPELCLAYPQHVVGPIGRAAAHAGASTCV